MATSGMTTVGKDFTEGPGDGGLSGSGDDLADGWSNVGMIQHHFDRDSVFFYHRWY